MSKFLGKHWTHRYSMGISKSTFILVVIFGSSSWIGTNSVWMQLPLLTARLPEGWGLPSYLAAVVQIACIGPLLYTIIHKGCPRIVLPTAPLIIIFLSVACVCQLGLAFFWSKTVTIGSNQYSIFLYFLLFGLAIVNAISNVLFMPFMAQFHSHYLNAYFVGMGFSSLVPSFLSLIQGSSAYDCVMTDGVLSPNYLPPRFSVSIFMTCIFIWTCMALCSFLILYKKGYKRKMSAAVEKDAHEGTPLNQHISENPENLTSGAIEELEQSHEIEIKEEALSGAGYLFLLLATALVNAQMNGVIPSVQSYAALPYSQTTYHYGIALSNIVSPLCSFLSFFVTVSSLKVLGAMTICSSVVTSFIIFLASLSPNWIFGSMTAGTILSIGAAMTAAGLHSYLRVEFASRLRAGHQSESRLFWCGVFIQIGSFIGSAVMFPLVNIVHIFKSAPACRA